MKLYRTTTGFYAEQNGSFYSVEASDWDQLIASPDVYERVKTALSGKPLSSLDESQILAPVGNQEVWAAGVTYFRSRDARIEESKDAGGGTFYDRVYNAERPELFFKATGRRVVGPYHPVRIRTDATWSVPEPELTLLISSTGVITGYTIGNDMSSRDIEGENPLYLPQAKVYDGSCALGPALLLTPDPLPRITSIQLHVDRNGSTIFSGATTLAELKRDPKLLAAYLFRDNTFPHGAFLMTGTGIVPGDDFTLSSGDVVRITIDTIGTLENPVA
ncbi:fumarylacetoacetate hydrolase family protein [Edaphobacter modestus]|uniref:2-dehydro-3-deoxy-D-arabinonate dehydratase n=1 Tax=Edaphobacter modestus TaxID=388466 RepID=A0A4Q7YYY7_9BACT|nr:fumarylacetoacetate hydrolase family protein [Edaphobacter modestus]RZU42423.1 2-dehydro-3-deoxy-D-arabinonate dehydratase [Edaphobacter modestus]